jgi:hypothetical protein
MMTARSQKNNYNEERETRRQNHYPYQVLKQASAAAIRMRGLFRFFLLLHVAQASITIVDTGQAFPSLPDKKLGQQLWKGYQYMGRLQMIWNNPQLCNTKEAMQVTVPEDSLPGKREREREREYTLCAASKEAYCILYTDTFCFALLCFVLVHLHLLDDP